MEIIIITLFFVIIFVLVVLAAVGSFRERQTKKAREFEREALYLETKTDLNQIMIKLGLYFDMLEDFLEDHDPLKGKYSLAQINSFGSEMLKGVKDSEKLRNIFKDELRREELKEHIDSLTSVKPSNWKREAYESYNIINAKSHVYINSPENKDLIEKLKEENEKAFTEYIGNN